MIPSDPAFYKHLLDRVKDGVYFVDRERRILYWNEGASRMTGYSSADLVGHRCQDGLLCHVNYEGQQLCQTACPLTACMEDGDEHTASVLLRNKEGNRLPVSIRGIPMRNSDGSIIGAIEVFSDDSANIEAARKAESLERMAFLDHVTQVPNRRYMELSLQSAMAEFEVSQDPFGVLMIDLDHFKQRNDTLGHGAGDRILREAARTLAASLRPSDIIGRWGGDEFVGIIRGVPTGFLVELADRCVAIMARTAISMESGDEITLHISVGATLASPGDTALSLVQRADQLMYRSKSEGRNRATIA